MYIVRQIMITPYNLREGGTNISTDLSEQRTRCPRSVYHFEHSYYLLQKKLPRNFSQENKVSYDFFFMLQLNYRGQKSYYNWFNCLL